MRVTRTLVHGVVAGAAVWASAATLAAQGPIPPARCDPTVPPAVVRRGVHSLIGEIRAERGSPQSVQTYATLLLRTLASHFSLPSPLPLASWTSRDLSSDSLALGDPVWVYPALPFASYVIINRNGTLRRLALAQSTLVPALDSALAEQLRAVVDTARLPAALLRSRRDSVVLLFATSMRDDSAPDPGGLDSGVVLQPLARLDLPHVRLDQAVRAVGDPPRVSYPTWAGRIVPRNGDVHFEFVIGTDGGVVPSTVRVRTASEPLFVEEAYPALLRERFAPPASGGCPVAVLVAQPFRFKVQHEYIVR
jgi:hypothetical protein